MYLKMSNSAVCLFDEYSESAFCFEFLLKKKTQKTNYWICLYNIF